MNVKECPIHLSEEFLTWLDQLFPPLLTSKDRDLRQCDLISGKREVVEFLKVVSKRQSNA